MTFTKPHRICNIAPALVAGPAEGNANCIKATLKELKNRYELRIVIPAFHKRGLAIYIIEGTLYVYENKETPADSHTVLSCFLLPGRVQQDEIKAYDRNYGLKIIMPFCRDKKVLRIPILQD